MFQHGETEWTYLAHEAEVEPGVLRAADFAGVPVLLTRTDDGIVALADAARTAARRCMRAS